MIEGTGTDFIILGDMNCDMKKKNSQWQAKQLFEIFHNNRCEQLIMEATRVTNNSSSLIDLIVTNNSQQIQSSGVLYVTLSDHYMVYCVKGKLPNCNVMHKYRMMRNIKKLKPDIVQNFIQRINFDCIQEYVCPQKAYGAFESKLNSILDDIAPIKRMRIKNKTSKWINQNILDLIEEKNAAKQTAKKSKDDVDWRIYKSLRNKVIAVIRKAKREYIGNCIENSSDSNTLFSSMQQFLPTKKKVCNNIPQLLINEEIIYDHKQIVNEFNDYFVSVGKNIQAQQTCPSQDMTFKNYCSDVSAGEFNFADVSESTVLKELKEISVKKATGPDEIPALFIKMISQYIAKPMCHIINMSLTQGIVPLQWKISRVTPIYKKGDKQEKSNYRPISVIPVLAKVIEKIVFKQIYEFLNDNNLLCDNQSGFRPKHSTTTTLLNITEDLFDNIDKGCTTGIVMLDLQKAFDCIDHHILLQKLRFIGMSEKVTKWFEGYLIGRKQFITMNGISSNTKELTCGIPQGTIVGPMLFSIYVNDLPTAVKHSKVLMYADDTCLYFSSNNVQELTTTLNKDLESVCEYLKCNKLKLNVKKCEFLVVGTRSKLNRLDPNIHLLVESIPILRVSSCKYLGVIIDENLSWNLHINEIRRKVLFKLYILRRIRPIITQRQAELFYKSMIQCHFDYCDIVYANTGVTNLRKLQILQNKALKTVLRKDPRFPTDQLFILLKLDNILERF